MDVTTSAEETGVSRHMSDYPTQKIPSGMCCMSDGLPCCHWSLRGGQLGWVADKGWQNWPSHFLAWVPASLRSLVPSGWCLGSCAVLYLASQDSGWLQAAHTSLFALLHGVFPGVSPTSLTGRLESKMSCFRDQKLRDGTKGPGSAFQP